jgi:hypothetical protein
MSEEVLVKCLRRGGRSVHSFIDAQGNRGWDLPAGGAPGKWKGPVEGVLKPHHNGLHLAKRDYLIDWLTEHNYVAEAGGEVAEGLDCVIDREARLVRHLPLDNVKLREFSENWLSVTPEILNALAVYPRISKDAQACMDAIRASGIAKAHEALEKLPEYKHVRLNAMRLSYDELHSIEYNHCTRASKKCLETIVSAFNLARMKASPVDFAKVISNQTAQALDATHQNLHFMKDLCAQGYDHQAEASAMENFLREKALLTGRPPNSAQDVTGFFARVRKRQNRDILPALGL